MFSVSISFTWGFFAYSKQSEVVILMLLMKQKRFLGVSSVSFFFLGGGGLIFVPIRSSRHLISPPLPTENWVPKKGVATFKITQLAFAYVRQ